MAGPYPWRKAKQKSLDLGFKVVNERRDMATNLNVAKIRVDNEDDSKEVVLACEKDIGNDNVDALIAESNKRHEENMKRLAFLKIKKLADATATKNSGTGKDKAALKVDERRIEPKKVVKFAMNSIVT